MAAVVLVALLPLAGYGDDPPAPAPAPAAATSAAPAGVAAGNAAPSSAVATDAAKAAPAEAKEPKKQTWVDRFRAYVSGLGALGYLVFAAVYIGVSLIPGGPAGGLTSVAGAVFGFVKGTILVSFSSVTAATIAFFLARSVLRKKVEKMAEKNPKVRSLSKAIEKEEGKMVALIRLSPLFPFTIINYLFGLMPVRPAVYVLTSWIAMLPGTAAYVYLGTAVTDLAGGASATKKTIQVVIMVAAVIATGFIARIATKAIKSAGVEDAPAPAAAASP